MEGPYGSQFVAGDRLLAQDAGDQWGEAMVTDLADRDGHPSLSVHFRGWGESHDDWIRLGSGRLKPTEKSRSLHGKSAFGRRMEIQWDEGVWYCGTVASFNPTTQQHGVARHVVLASGWGRPPAARGAPTRAPPPHCAPERCVGL